MSWDNPDQIAGNSIPDGYGTQVLAPTAFIPLLYDDTTMIDVFGNKAVDWVLYITNLGAGPISQVSAKVQFSEKAQPSAVLDSDWATIQSQAVNNGQATLNDYVINKAISSPAPVTLGITSPARGRWMRLLITASAGDPTNSVVEVRSLKR
jgi:hypothetical protein